MEECNICAEKFNFSNRRPIRCLYCNFEACRKCCQSYILNKELSVCMNVNKGSNGEFICQKPWNRKFMAENFPNTWIKNEWTNMTKKEVDMVGFEARKGSVAGGRQIGTVCDLRNARQNTALAGQHHAPAQFRRARQNLSQQGFGLAKSRAAPVQPVNIGIVDKRQAEIERMGNAVGRGFDIRIDKAPAPKSKRADLKRPDFARVTINQIFVFARLPAHL